MVDEVSVTNLTTDIQILPETFQVWKYQYLCSDLSIVIVSVWKKKMLSNGASLLTGWEVEDLTPKKAFNTTAPTATKPPLHNLQLVYMWLFTVLLYEVVEDSIFLFENDGLPSDTWQRDHFENQDVRIPSNEADKTKRNTNNLTHLS